MFPQPPVIQLDSYLQDGDITALAKHFGCTRKTIYRHLRQNNPQRKRGVVNNEVRMYAINMVRHNIEQMRERIDMLEKALPTFVA
jgi:ABC-type phosphate transport system ATPase subunit